MTPLDVAFDSKRPIQSHGRSDVSGWRRKREGVTSLDNEKRSLYTASQNGQLDIVWSLLDDHRPPHSRANHTTLRDTNHDPSTMAAIAANRLSECSSPTLNTRVTPGKLTRYTRTCICTASACTRALPEHNLPLVQLLPLQFLSGRKADAHLHHRVEPPVSMSRVHSCVPPPGGDVYRRWTAPCAADGTAWQVHDDRDPVHSLIAIFVPSVPADSLLVLPPAPREFGWRTIKADD
ncbi:hypothetical protein H4582DRAFT_2072181 [Lactarius indigo]|nr:hypothetical protein H4582DRAFT_2072181 [Lactarius indigo]